MFKYEIILIRKKDCILIKHASFIKVLFYKIYAKLKNYEININKKYYRKEFK